MNKRHWLGIAVIVLFIAFSAYSFSKALTPYVTFAQAKNLKGSVQVRGVLVNDKVLVTNNGKQMQFTLRDEDGEEALVYYNGVAPESFDQATGIVALGKYSGGRFQADKLLIKCPSKYQGSGKKP